MKLFIRVLMTLSCVVLLAGMTDSVILSGINQGTMAELFSSCARVSGHDEITAADYSSVAAEIVAYLKTGRDEDIPEIRGEKLFSERENLHLKDCAGIIRGMLAFRAVFLCLMAMLAALFVFLKARYDSGKVHGLMRLASGCMAFACMGLLAAALGLTAWGLVDFDALFINFHRVFFSNNLWILDPSRDLLIQLMPQPFFERYAFKILTSLIPCLGIMILFPILYLRLIKKEDRNS